MVFPKGNITPAIRAFSPLGDDDQFELSFNYAENKLN